MSALPIQKPAVSARASEVDPVKLSLAEAVKLSVAEAPPPKTPQYNSPSPARLSRAYPALRSRVVADIQISDLEKSMPKSFRIKSYDQFEELLGQMIRHPIAILL